MLAIEEITSVRHWCVLLSQIEYAYSRDFALGVEMAMASHMNGVHRLTLRKNGYFSHPDVTKDIHRAQGYDYGALLTEQMAEKQPAVYEELQRMFPWREVYPSFAK